MTRKPTPEQQLAMITEALSQCAEMMEPLIEMAEGQKKKLEDRGWSPTASEAVGLEILTSMVRKAFE